ncbi:hypothetical protein MUDAN_BIHEEGNE_00318 [Lactiplantibacillus mudanjiangensis]|uniref:DUF2075 domain-containing protein n=1 Tax=Lactiplantibacillus mudanjiangensis TaxID=1296538 RepID=UPI001015C2D3|nr:hypothetical protein MUDAN_BIHEEGNE_00318 [Lactiplantibacillus mudanjiangensis]
MDETKSIEPAIDVKPIVDVVPYNVDYKKALEEKSGDDELIFEYPTVYVIADKQDKKKDAVPQFTAYVGETSDISQRTRQHLDSDTKIRDDWQQLKDSANAEMMVIGDHYFNKSLTLDIENRLMMYLLGVDHIKHLNNRRTNPQRKYFMSDQFDQIFTSVWSELRKKKPELFPVQSDVESSAIFKASPFHALNEKQLEGKNKIFNRVEQVLINTKQVDNQEAAVIFIAGQAGTGKTVLLSNLFNDLVNSNLTGDNAVNLLVNHDQQLIVYKQIAHKLGLDRDNDDVVCKPTRFINEHQKPGARKADVILVDEAHLLWTHGKQSYRGQNQLQDLLKLAKVVIIVFDKYQILTTDEYLDDEEINRLERVASRTGNTITLKDQERMDASIETIDWLHDFSINQQLGLIPDDDRYELKVARDPATMYQKIKALDQQKGKNPASLARMLATFDWKFVSAKRPDDDRDKTWNVTVGDWSLPWNLQLKVPRKQKKKNQALAWAEQAQTIDEIGSTYTIQGFDLNYAGLIIGPSVTYRDGKIVFNPSASMNKRATNKRTWKGEKIDVAKELLRNELNVLLTRGVHGLFIYAVDEELQQALLAAAGTTHILGEN